MSEAKIKLVQCFVLGSNDLFAVPLPFFYAFFDEDNVFTDIMTEFMSCVLMIVVILYSAVISWIRSSIISEVLGSRPEFGSSQNRYLGFRAIARAMAARFIIPPLSQKDRGGRLPTGSHGPDRTGHASNDLL